MTPLNPFLFYSELLHNISYFYLVLINITFYLVLINISFYFV